MPEGDTVWRTARRLDAALSGHELTTSDFRVPQWAEVDLSGQRVLETVSRGKHLLTRLAEVTVHTHLKMEGSWHLYRRGTRWRSPAFQARVVLANLRWQAVGFRLGAVDLVERSAEDTLVGHLGPDLLGPDWSMEEAMRRLTAKPGRPVGEALLDQRNLAGIGNMYKAEACFLMGVNPFTPVGDVETLPRLVDKAQRLLTANKDRAVQTTTGDQRRGEALWVYARRGQPCRRCGTPIRAIDLHEDGIERATYWCPRCQPGPES
ncbi:MAG: endonuclease [Pseudonocardiales bacterium]|nr:endonuclease [Pseudonocardiales bacterium]